MLGRLIDGLALSLLGAAALYGFFLNAGFGIVKSAILAFLLTCLIRFLIEQRPRRYAFTEAQARAALESVLSMEDGEAEAALKAIVEAQLRPPVGEIVPILRHSEGQLSPDEVYRQWRGHRQCDKIVLTVTCPAAPSARALAGTLERPEVVLADRSALLRAIRETGLYVPDTVRAPIWPRLRRRLSWLMNRPVRPKTALYSALLLGLYLSTGRLLCLWMAMLLLFHMGASWIRAHG